MEDINIVLDFITWSFSKLNSYYKCPYAWKKRYIDCEDVESDFFAEVGTSAHHTLEKYYKKEVDMFSAVEDFENEWFENVVHDAPCNKYVDIKQSTYDKIHNYFENINIDLDKIEVLGVEEKVEFEIKGKKFVGYIDVLYRDKETDEIVILDHKSSIIKLLKNGNISKTDMPHFTEFKRQELLYSIPVIKKYGRVDKLQWNMFKTGNIITIPWSKEELDEAIKWAEDTLDIIANDVKHFPDTSNQFFCDHICDMKHICEYRVRYDDNTGEWNKYQ